MPSTPAELPATLPAANGQWTHAITLMGQPFVKDPDQSVQKLLDAAKAKVTRYERLEVGAGIEKKQDDFVAEVMAQAKGSGG